MDLQWFEGSSLNGNVLVVEVKVGLTLCLHVSTWNSVIMKLSYDDKLSLILSKLSLNESRVVGIQNKLDSIIGLETRIQEIETVVNSHADRLKLSEYRSLDLEAGSRRKNLLFKGLLENRQENCFEEVRHFIHSKLNIDRDMYLERAHRLGHFNTAKTRPIIVAFRDFCDIDEILNASSQLKGTEFGVSKDYPSEISKARQSLWNQFKTVRANNPNRRVTVGYPANISIDNETIIDLFPDWFQILQGSRVSRVQSTQTNDQNINTETGLSRLLNLTSETHMSMPTSDMTSGSCLIGSDLENYGSVSPERASAMQVDEQFSPFLCPATKSGGVLCYTLRTFECLSVRPSVCLSVCPSVRLSVRPSVRAHSWVHIG